MKERFNDLNSQPEISFDILSGYENFIPEDFKNNPLDYFNNFGSNIKAGEVKVDETGRVREDPTAVKILPIWQDFSGNNLEVVGKKINLDKAQIKKTNNPFHEYEVLEIANKFGLPAAKPIAKIKQADDYLFLMEKIKGLNIDQRLIDYLKQNGLTRDEINNLKEQAESSMRALKTEFDKIGLIRDWSLKDMVIELSDDKKSLINITPTDWERTKILNKL